LLPYRDVKRVYPLRKSKPASKSYEAA